MYLKSILLFLLLSFFYIRTLAQQPAKMVAECTITYTVHIKGNMNEEATKKLFIKGRKVRSELSNATFYQATIFDNKTGEAVVLKELGGNKFISSFTVEQWKEKNKLWNDVSVKLTGETKTILNYACRKAISTLKDGRSFVVYYTADFTASATENPYQFKDIPGLVLEYESQTDNAKDISFTAININFNPVPAAMFAIPTTGYRMVK